MHDLRWGRGLLRLLDQVHVRMVIPEGFRMPESYSSRRAAVMTQATADELLALAERVEQAEKSDNALDVLVETALFQPGSVYTAIRANAAGTKVIYTDRAGNNVTCWAEDWTMDRRRIGTADALRARAHLIKDQGND